MGSPRGTSDAGIPDWESRAPAKPAPEVVLIGRGRSTPLSIAEGGTPIQLKAAASRSTLKARLVPIIKPNF
jgi:hypothetical protein